MLEMTIFSNKSTFMLVAVYFVIVAFLSRNEVFTQAAPSPGSSREVRSSNPYYIFVTSPDGFNLFPCVNRTESIGSTVPDPLTSNPTLIGTPFELSSIKVSVQQNVNDAETVKLVRTETEKSNSIGGSLDIDGSGWGVTVTATAAFNKMVTVTDRSQHYSITSRRDSTRVNLLFDELQLNAVAENMLINEPETFIKVYGRHYVQSYTIGCKLDGFNEIISETVNECTDISASLAASLKKGPYNAEGSADFNQMINNTNSNTKVTGQATVIGVQIPPELEAESDLTNPSGITAYLEYMKSHCPSFTAETICSTDTDNMAYITQAFVAPLLDVPVISKHVNTAETIALFKGDIVSSDEMNLFWKLYIQYDSLQNQLVSCLENVDLCFQTQWQYERENAMESMSSILDNVWLDIGTMNNISSSDNPSKTMRSYSETYLTELEAKLFAYEDEIANTKASERIRISGASVKLHDTNTTADYSHEFSHTISIEANFPTEAEVSNSHTYHGWDAEDKILYGTMMNIAYLTSQDGTSYVTASVLCTNGVAVIQCFSYEDVLASAVEFGTLNSLEHKLYVNADQCTGGLGNTLQWDFSVKEDFSDINIPDKLGSSNGTVCPYSTQKLAYLQFPLIKEQMETKNNPHRASDIAYYPFCDYTGVNNDYFKAYYYKGSSTVYSNSCPKFSVLGAKKEHVVQSAVGDTIPVVLIS